MEIIFKEIDINSLLNNIPEIEKDCFYYSYEPFLNYFDSNQKITTDNFIVATNMIYGWMPTMLHNKKYFKSKDFSYIDDINNATEVINRVRNKKTITSIDIELITKVTNNSIVGASKLLHIASPDDFPIWDSWINKYMKPKFIGKNTSDFKKDTLMYLEYRKILLKAIETESFKNLYKKISDKVEYNISALRALELAIFLIIRESNKKTASKIN